MPWRVQNTRHSIHIFSCTIFRLWIRTLLLAYRSPSAVIEYRPICKTMDVSTKHGPQYWSKGSNGSYLSIERACLRGTICNTFFHATNSTPSLHFGRFVSKLYSERPELWQKTKPEQISRDTHNRLEASPYQTLPFNLSFRCTLNLLTCPHLLRIVKNWVSCYSRLTLVTRHRRGHRREDVLVTRSCTTFGDLFLLANAELLPHKEIRLAQSPSLGILYDSEPALEADARYGSTICQAEV